MSSPIIVALDEISQSDALKLANELKGLVWGYKVNDLLLDCGVEIISQLQEFGNVFADPKLHDIPNTVKNSVERLTRAGANFITVHASGGSAMLRNAVQASGSARILAVLTMTSLVDEDTRAIYCSNVDETWKRLATLALEIGVHGVICSGPELPQLQTLASVGIPKPQIVVTPGIRPAWYGTADDQNRVNTPHQALLSGATHLVIGRPITKAKNPREAVEKIIQEIA